MPESLQSSPTGELLQERIDALENTISDLESIDCEYEDEGEEEDGREKDPDLEAADDRLREWLDEKEGELQDISFEG
jgi:hypothetical protein